jgi:tetratricopeptide (TPR) repeat protein
VLAAIAVPDYPRATQLAIAALNGGFEHPLFYNLRAFWLEGRGNDRAALHDLERARDLAPTDPGILNALGLSLARQERFQEALAAFDLATAAKPDFAQAYFNKAGAYESLNDFASAATNFSRALELKPDFVEPLARLAQLATRRHDWKQVEEFAARALAVEENLIMALDALATSALERKDHSEAEALLERALNSGIGGPLEKSTARSHLGDVRHEQKRYAEAFKLFTQANFERRTLYAARFDAPGTRTTAFDYAVWLRDYYQKAASQWQVTAENASTIDGGVRRHVFLVGFPRSGTTLLEQALAGHPDVVTSEELEGMRGLIRQYMANAQGRDHLATLSGTALDEYRAQYWATFDQYGLDVKDKVFIDKHPLSTQMLPLIAKLFPTAKILFAIRDPRDVVFGCFRRPFRVNPAMFEFLTLRGTARFYDAVMGIGEICRKSLGLQWHDVYHEALIDDFDGQLLAATKFIGIEWNDAMREFAERARVRATRTPSAVQLARGLNRSGMGQWRHYAQELAPILPILKPWVERFGYEPD